MSNINSFCLICTIHTFVTLHNISDTNTPNIIIKVTFKFAVNASKKLSASSAASFLSLFNNDDIIMNKLLSDGMFAIMLLCICLCMLNDQSKFQIRVFSLLHSIFDLFLFVLTRYSEKKTWCVRYFPHAWCNRSIFKIEQLLTSRLSWHNTKKVA